jgi:hypothetical protein
MNRGLVTFMLITMAMMALPAFFIFLDYHKRSNIHKAVLFVVTLSAVGLVVITAAPHDLLLAAAAIPVLLFASVAVARWGKRR